MKKKKNIVTLAILAVITFVALPKDVLAVTLKEYEDNVAKYTKELQEKEAKIAKSQEEVEQVKKNIASIEGQITETKNSINTLEKEIEESNKKIDNKKEESKKILKYFQVVNGENTYLEYVFDATSITDMIYRMSVVEQLADYNQKVVKELKELINQNKIKKEELSKKQEELSKLKKQLESEKERIQQDIMKTEGTLPNTKEAIKSSQALVDFYKKKGCKSNDVIGITCAVVPKNKGGGGSTSNVNPGTVVGSNGFRRPVVGGRISWGYGVGGHKGVDFSFYGRCGAPIYAVAAGTVYYVGDKKDNYGAKMVLIVHNVNGRLVFSQYAHLQGYNVREGQEVDINTVIGYMGSTGYSSGCHLHLEMSEDYGWDYNTTHPTYVKHIINPFNYIPS